MVSEHSGVELPMQLEALLKVEATVYVGLSARANALQIRAPFGELTIPYACIIEATSDVTGGIGLDMAGAKIWLDVSDFPDRNALLAFLKQKMVKPGGHAT